MKLWKILLPVTLCLVLAVLFLPTTAHAATSGYYTYEVEDGEATITDCSTSISGNITIPSTLGGYPVTTIGEYAFYECTSLTGVTIPDSVTTIGNGAFRDCTSLTDVTIPDSVTTIGDEAFFYCTSLTGVTIGNSVTTIGDSAFLYCTSLTIVTIPVSVTTIGEDAFSWCSSLTSVTIPNSVKTIDDYAFYECSSLTSVTIGNSVTTIRKSAFYFCDSLTDVYYAGTEEQWDAISVSSGNEKLLEATVHYNIAVVPENEQHNTIATLTDADYLAFSAISYMDFSTGSTVKELLCGIGKWDAVFSEDQNITYSDLCGHIAQWRVDRTLLSNLSDLNGFYAIPFANGAGEVVLAYRGSVPPTDLSLDNAWDFLCDWIGNDLPMEIANMLGPQYSCAIAICNAAVDTYGIDHLVVTGHSLGGAWADVASAYSGCKGVTFNAVSVLDAVYNAKPAAMGRMFRGVNRWNLWIMRTGMIRWQAHLKGTGH